MDRFNRGYPVPTAWSSNGDMSQAQQAQQSESQNQHPPHHHHHHPQYLQQYHPQAQPPYRYYQYAQMSPPQSSVGMFQYDPAASGQLYAGNGISAGLHALSASSSGNSAGAGGTSNMENGSSPQISVGFGMHKQDLDLHKQQDASKSALDHHQQPYRQFVTTLLDSSTNKLVQITSQPPPDYVAAKKRRNRISISCMSCKRRKVKCDRERPICGSCQRHGYSVCVYAANDNDDSNKIRRHDNDSSNEDLPRFPSSTGLSSDNPGAGANGDGLVQDRFKFENDLILKPPQGLTNSGTAVSASSVDSSSPSHEFTNLLMVLEQLKLTHIQNDEIDQLKTRIEHLRFYLDDESISSSRTLKGLKLIPKIPLKPVLQTSSNVALDSFNLQLGASSITSYTEVDSYMGRLFKKSLPKIENDLNKWKSYFSVEIYRKALEKVFLSEKYSVNENLSLTDLKLAKFKLICKLLENYFVNYDNFATTMARSKEVLTISVPIVPRALIDQLLDDHFVKSESNKLEIVKIESDDDSSEILLVLAILRFGLPKSENVITTPDEIDYKTLLDYENITTDHKTDLLNSFLKLILHETDLSQKFNIPMLGTLVILFMISYTHRFNFKSGSTGVGLNYGVMAIYMAVNLGVYGGTKPADESKHQYLKFFKDSDFHNMWNLVMFIDTFSSFNSGIPQLISSGMDNMYVTPFVDSNCASICHFYRKAFTLANKSNTKKDDVSIIQYERFVIEFESFIVNKLVPTSVCIKKNDLVGVATSIRALNLLLFLYYNSYFSFIKTYENYKKNNNAITNPNYESMLQEFRELDKRLFERCIKLSIVSLIDLNIMLVSMFSEKDESFYEKYSFDLIQIFTRIIYTLTSCMCRMIVIRKREREQELDAEREHAEDKGSGKRKASASPDHYEDSGDNNSNNENNNNNNSNSNNINYAEATKNGKNSEHENNSEKNYSSEETQYSHSTGMRKGAGGKHGGSGSGANSSEQKSNSNENFNFLFDISRGQSEMLSNYFVASQYSSSLDGVSLELKFGPDIMSLSRSVDALSENPSAMIRLLIGFFFNTSQSLISQNFIYYTLYKYFVMAVKQLEETEGCTDTDDFDIDKFETHFSYVDCTWFIN